MVKLMIDEMQETIDEQAVTIGRQAEELISRTKERDMALEQHEVDARRIAELEALLANR